MSRDNNSHWGEDSQTNTGSRNLAPAPHVCPSVVARHAIIPVIDILDGKVVHARAGLDRRQYEPIRSCLVDGHSPPQVARALVDATGCRCLYVADLNGLDSGKPAWTTLKSMSVSGVQLWIDTGIRNSADALAMSSALQGVDYRPIVATESLERISDLSHIVREFQRRNSGHVIGSLDFTAGKFQAKDPGWQRSSAVYACRDFIAAGVESILVLDVADVGGLAGCTSAAVCRDLRREFPGLQLSAGGGVGVMEDVQGLLDLGCQYVLVATALHDGRIGQGAQGAGQRR